MAYAALVAQTSPIQSEILMKSALALREFYYDANASLQATIRQQYSIKQMLSIKFQ
jgi:hypothetical protein